MKVVCRYCEEEHPFLLRHDCEEKKLERLGRELSSPSHLAFFHKQLEKHLEDKS